MKKGKKALICLNGQAPDKAVIMSKIKQVDYIVAVDGGLNWLMDYQVKPHVVIGDLDSAKPEYVQQVKRIHIEDQHSTDLEKALSHIETIDVTDVEVVGIESGRVDHFLCNFFLLWKYTSRFLIEVTGDTWVGVFLEHANQISLSPGSVVSLIPFTDCKGVTLQGVKYPLTNHMISLGDVGISNVSQSSDVYIEIMSGKMLGVIFDVGMKWKQA